MSKELRPCTEKLPFKSDYYDAYVYHAGVHTSLPLSGEAYGVRRLSLSLSLPVMGRHTAPCVAYGCLCVSRRRATTWGVVGSAHARRCTSGSADVQTSQVT